MQPRYWRCAEVAGLVTFALLVSLVFFEVWRHAVGSDRWSCLLAVSLGLLFSILLTDYISGFVHFLADNFGTESTPLLGPNIIQPFREHHVDPLALTRHGFVELNGNNSLICLPLLVSVVLLSPDAPSAWAAGLLSCAGFFCLGIFLTNQIHMWAHLESPPGWVVPLQRSGLILSTEHHDKHHSSPFKSHYCITTGWWNGPLDGIGFWAFMERLLGPALGPARKRPGRVEERPGRVEVH